jgi:hypothetical protein
MTKHHTGYFLIKINILVTMYINLYLAFKLGLPLNGDNLFCAFTVYLLKNCYLLNKIFGRCELRLIDQLLHPYRLIENYIAQMNLFE